MQPNDDSALLRRYAENQSDEAFAELVTRYLNLVYSVALRQVGRPHQAEEIAQAVFIILAKKAPQLRHHQALSSWLFQTTRLTANNYLRGEIRRQRREQEAYMQSMLNEPTGEAWPQIAPLLDAAVAGLGDKDRRAILLRFYEGRSLRDAGLALGASEAATEKRVSRAVEKLRAFLRKRGIVLSAAAIAAAASANSVSAAPTGLATTVSAIAATKGATASASALTLIKGALKVMAWSKAKTAIVVVGVAILLAAGTTTTMTAIQTYRSEVWRKGFDLSVLDTARRQATILPALRSRPEDVKGWRRYHGMFLGLNQDVAGIARVAYGVNRARMIFSAASPAGSYDYISNVPQNQSEALQLAIKKEFSLAGRREMIETNVLFLTVRNPNAAGLKPTATEDMQLRNSDGFIVRSNYPIASLVTMFENYQDSPVVDRTGLTDYFDLKCDAKDDTAEGLKKAVLDNLGLELVPGKDRVEFLVMEKAN